jgi:hypothetical protein
MPANPVPGKTAADGGEPAPGRTARSRRVFSPARVLWFAVVVAALVLAAAVIALELGAIAAGFGLFSVIGSFALPVLGPVLVVAALPAIGLGLWRRRHGPRRTGP